MPWTYNLTDGTTTVSLNSGDYDVLYNGFSAPVPRRRMAWGGRNLFRHGADLMERRFENRRVTLRIKITGSNDDALENDINAINDLLERAAEYSSNGLGAQVQLTRQWNGATNSVSFDVLEGTLDIPETSIAHVQRNVLIPCILTLTCKPFAVGSAETIENFVADPSFEIAGTALADWTENITATGTTARVTTDARHGAASLELVMTNSGASGQVVERTQSLADVDAAEVWSFGFWVYFVALSNAMVVIDIEYTGGGSTSTFELTAVNTGYALISIVNETVPASTTAAVFKCRLESTAASATGTARIDACIAVRASSLPTTWVSGRSIVNHNDDDGQAHINYIDIYNVPGDVPALLQVKLDEAEAHDTFWAGARHHTRMTDSGIYTEGETGTTTGINSPANFSLVAAGTGAIAAASDGNVEVNRIRCTTNATLPAGTYFRTEWTLSSPPSGQYRVLLVANFQNSTTSIGVDYDRIRFGLSWTYGAVTLLDDTAPDTSSFVAFASSGTVAPAAASNREVFDLGTVTVPPILTPDNQTAANFVLKVFCRINYSIVGFVTNDDLDIHLDFIMLMPVDFGANFVSKTSAQDVILLDSESQPGGLWLLNTSDVVQSYPTNQRGGSPTAHPGGTRIYFLSENSNAHDITHGHTVEVRVVPQMLQVQGT